MGELLASRFHEIHPAVAAPIFACDRLLFPWEALYEGADHRQPDPQWFWGLRHSPARALNGEDPSRSPEQDATSRMLFCLHHGLRETHQREWPQLERLVKIGMRGSISLLGPAAATDQICDGYSLLERLDQGAENMVHFACHAARREAGADALLVSLIDVADLIDLSDKTFSPPVIELDTNAFTLRPGVFQRRPLVFLNACHSGGGGDQLRETYNLPAMFIDRRAGAVVALACPVPDIFAAEFARVFYCFFLHGRESIDRQLIEHALRCPHEDILQCPNFSGLITARLAGQPLHEAHSH